MEKEINKASKCMKQFSTVVTLEMLESMAAPPKEGLYLDAKSVEMMVTSTEQIIRAYYEVVTKDIAYL